MVTKERYYELIGANRKFGGNHPHVSHDGAHSVCGGCGSHFNLRRLPIGIDFAYSPERVPEGRVYEELEEWDRYSIVNDTLNLDEGTLHMRYIKVKDHNGKMNKVTTHAKMEEEGNTFIREHVPHDNLIFPYWIDWNCHIEYGVTVEIGKRERYAWKELAQTHLKGKYLCFALTDDCHWYRQLEQVKKNLEEWGFQIVHETLHANNRAHESDNDYLLGLVAKL